MFDANVAVSLPALLRVFRRRIWTIVLTTLVVLASGVVTTLLMPVLYEASAYVLVEPVATEPLVSEQAAPNISQRPVIVSVSQTGMETEAVLATSRPAIDALIRKLDLRGPDGSTLATLRRDGPVLPLFPYPSLCVKAKRQGATDILRLSGYAETPALAAAMANTLAEFYVENRRAAAEGQLARTMEFLDEQVTKLRAALRDERWQADAVDTNREIVVALTRLLELIQSEKSRALEMQATKLAMDPIEKELRKVLSEKVMDALAVSDASVVALRGQLEALEARRIDARSGADLDELNRETAAVREKIRMAIVATGKLPRESADRSSNKPLQDYLDSRVDLIALQAQRKVLNDLIAAQRTALLLLPARASAVAQPGLLASASADTKREGESVRRILALAAAMRMTSARVVESAVEPPPGEPYCPVLPLNAAACLIIGLGLGVFLALAREYRDGSATS